MQSAQRKTYDNAAPHPAKKRTVKMRGNVAYINNDFLSTEPLPQPRTQPRPSQKPQPRRGAKPLPKPASRPIPQSPETAKKQATGRGLVSTLFVLFVGFCALALLVSRHAAVASIGVQNNALQRDIAAVETQIENMKVELELRNTLESIQNTARQELGMTYPVQNEKIYIDLNGR